MKKIRTVAVILILLQILYGHISNASLYKTMFGYLSDNIRSLIQTVSWMAVDATLLVCGLLFLFSSLPSVKDRSYVLLRFIYLVSALLMLPSSLLFIFKVGIYRNVELQLSYWIGFAAARVVWLASIVLLIMGRPVNSIERVDLSQYQLVSYTSTWHRFVHYLLDMLFLLPVILTWMDIVPGVYDSPLTLEGLLILLYLTYCFIAEAFFRQTFGKLITGSCLVSNGVQLSAGRVFLRTLSRLIPFDKLSFLFGGNWHDRVSNTTVVYINSWEKVFEDIGNGQTDKG